MTAPKQHRWTCECGSTVLAPRQPRKNDVRRFCMKCSMATGFLVERTCPVLDAERAGKKERAAAKTTSRRNAERELAKAKHTVDGVDLLAEAKRFWQLPTIVDALQEALPEPQAADDRVASVAVRKHASTGRCWPWSNKIVVTLGSSVADAQSTLLHEIVHDVLPGEEWHGRLFQSTLRSAYAEAFPKETT